MRWGGEGGSVIINGVQQLFRGNRQTGALRDQTIGQTMAIQTNNKQTEVLRDCTVSLGGRFRIAGRSYSDGGIISSI